MPLTKCTWKAWKKAFLAVHQTAKRTQKSNKDCCVSLGSANSTTQPHQQQSPAYILPDIKAYMKSIDAEATTNHSTLEILVASSACLCSTTEK